MESKLEKLKQRAFKNSEVRQEYDDLSDEFEMTHQLLTMRSAAELTQGELVRLMGTQKSNISRLETGNSNPSWKTLQKYAHACGFEIAVNVQNRHKNKSIA